MQWIEVMNDDDSDTGLGAQLAQQLPRRRQTAR
jgi:hypothetical protein